MNLCLIASTLPPVTGGLESHVWELARGLQGRGHRVSLIGWRNWQGRAFPEREERAGIAIYREMDTVLPVYRFRYKLYALRAARRALRLHRRDPFDLIHAHQEYPAGTAGALAGLRAGIPLLITCHGSSLLLNREVNWLRPVLDWTLRRAERVIGVGETLRGAIRAAGVPDGRIEILSNFVDAERFRPDGSGGDIRARWGWGERETVVAFLGRLDPVKGADLFLEMARRLHAGGADLKYLIIGTGAAEGELRRRAQEIGSEVAFAGSVASDKVPAYLRAVDIVVVPSRREAGGISCLEAMAAGKAVVASRVGGLSAAVRDGESGLLVEVGAEAETVSALAGAVRRLIGDPALRRRLGEAARREASVRFGRGPYLDRLETLYREARR